MKYVLGLDLGVASIGWAAVEVDDNDMPIRITDHGSVIFKALDNDKGKLYNQDRRAKRGQRRVIRRRKERLRRIKNLIIDYFGMNEKEYYDLFNAKGVKQDNDILELNVYGLEKELNREQLIRVLVNYAKNRGFKSNRKMSSKEEQGKMKNAISNIGEVMSKHNCTVSKAVLMYQKEKGLDVRHNTDGDSGYNYGFNRSDIQEEIEALLDKQIKLGVIDTKFKDEYIKIWGSQRDYSDGPAYGPYHVDFRKTFGACSFRPNETRASKGCPSYELFTLLQKLQNIRYYLVNENGDYIKDGKRNNKFSLTKDQTKEIYGIATNKDITYGYIRDIIKKTLASECEVEIIDLPSLSKDKFNKVIGEYKKKNNIANDAKLNDKQYLEAKKLAKEKQHEATIYDLKSYKELKKQLKKLKYEEKVDDIEFLDDVAKILAFAKTDEKIEQIIDEMYRGRFSKEEIELIKRLDLKETGTASLSLSLIQDLLDLMLDGYTYDKAMEKLGYDHSNVKHNKFENGFPTIEEIENNYHTVITNPNVKHTLVYLRKLYNQIVATYGAPHRVHVELARDISKSFTERNKIKNEQRDNYANKQRAKLELFEALGLDDIERRTYRNYTNDDILKFQLWKEQNHRCAYSGREINRDQLLGNNEVNIDHILPFSRSFDDSYANKVLVFTKENEDKKNRTPFEWFGSDRQRWREFKDRIENNSHMSQKKKNNLLTEDEVTYDEFSARSLNATTYMSKLALNIFKDLLNIEDGDDKVRAFKGGATSFLRKYYRLNQYTHSYESKDYKRSDTKYVIDPKDMSIKISANKVSIEAKAKDKYGRELDYKRVIEKKKDKQLSADDQAAFDALYYHKDKVYRFLLNNVCSIDIESIQDADLFEEARNASEKDDKFVIMNLAYDLVSEIKADLIAKNRENHFHHEVDAILVAIMTRSMQLKITKFSKMINDDRRQLLDGITGETYATIDDLLKAYNVETAEKNPKFYLPQPYDNFIEELVIKVFERDESILNRKLTELLGTENHECIKYPSFQASKKVSGALHEETIFGHRKENGVDVVVTRRSVTTIDKKKINSIYDGDGGQKPVKEAIEKWLDLPSNNRPKYPIHPMTGQYIKKVKVIGDSFDKVMKISKTNDQKGYAGIGSVARIQIYKRDDSDNLFFVQLSIDKYLSRKKGSLDFNVLVWEGRGEKRKLVSYKDVEKQGYHLYQELYPGQLVHVVMKDRGEIDAITVGFSSGLFEIKSIIGDQIDLLNNKIIGKYRERDTLTVSTIKDIYPIKIDIMGYLCHTANS